MTIRKPQKGKVFPYRKQFTMPKRLPSTGMDNMLHDNNVEQTSLDLTDTEDFPTEELKLIQKNQ